MSTKDTYLGYEISSSDVKSQYDEHVRRLIRDKGVLAYIMKYTVEEFKDYSFEEAKSAIDDKIETATKNVRPEAVGGRQNESKIPGEGTMFFDIVFFAITREGEHRKLYINIEAQKSFYPGYDLVTRGIIYPARLLSEQMDVEYTADNYDGAKKVYSIWICMNTHPGIRRVRMLLIL
jgi:hypothetical protein